MNDQQSAEIRDSIRRILYHEWDPIGIAGTAPENEYDSYINPVYQILTGTRSEQELCELLFQIARDTIGVASNTPEHFKLGRSTAHKLLAIKVEPKCDSSS